MVALDTTSRYALDASGQTASAKINTDGVQYSLHLIGQGDTISNVAARLLGNDRRWWEIADINPQVKFPEDLVVGDYLRIPR